MNNAVYNDPASIQAAEGIFGNQVARQNTVAPVNQLVPQPAVNLGVTQPVDTAAVATKATAQQVDPITGLLLQPTVPNQNIR
tara:strand:- start:183 stop:428 length:246 start_codon:yes stop_codon:yes gene_type:complete